MPLADHIAGILVLVGLALIIYTKQKHQTLKETFEEMKSLLKGGDKDE